MSKISVEEAKAIRIKANGDKLMETEGINGFARVWLNITNNHREHKQDILKVYNDYGNGIYVVCDAEESNVKAVEDYLQRLGLVVEYKEEVVIVMTEEVFDKSSECLDVELIDW